MSNRYEIRHAEWYPVRRPEKWESSDDWDEDPEDFEEVYEISDALLERYRLAEAEFFAVQKLLIALEKAKAE